ncbi:MAG: hypothetical protein GY711_23620 [bacterium]|nr:hypothetical protein [bacterium]
MEIHFCDLCNESVPQSDLDAGNAFVRKGRVVCAACDQAMGGGSEDEEPGSLAPDSLGSAPAHGQATPHVAGASATAPTHGAPAGRRSGAGGVLVGMLAIAFSAAGFALVVDRMDGIGDDMQTASLELRREVNGLRRAQDSMSRTVGTRMEQAEARMQTEREATKADVEQTIAGVRAELGAVTERIDGFTTRFTELRTTIDEGDAAAAERARLLGEQLISFEKDMRFYSDRIIELEESLRVLSTRPMGAAPGVVDGGASGEGGGAQPPAGTPAWQPLLADLQHANAGIRLDAVYALGETRDRDVIPYLIPMLGDVDLFVRMATARVLEDLEARTAVPSLIDALEDPSSAVREAAMIALRHITGHDFRFDPTEASEAKRAKGVKAWRDWWKKNGDDFLAGG